MTVPSKEEQRKEAEDRRTAMEANGVARDGGEADATSLNDPVDGADGGDGGERREPRQPQQDEPRQPRERAMSPGDRARMEMANRFRRPAEEEQPFSGDINDPEVVYGESARQMLQPEPADGDMLGTGADDGEPEPQRQPEPKTFRLKINGQEVELTEAQVLERAQKVSAADSYLDEAKTLLKEAKQIKRTRGGADVDADQIDNENHDEPEEPTSQRRDQNPDQRLQEAVEKIQFGDREEAAKVLGEVIDEVADRKTDERQLKRLIDNDFAKSQQSLKAFTDANSELAQNEIFAAGMEATMYRLYREEIEKLGVVEASQIPTDNKTLANWHRYYRVHGADVSNTDALLTTAKNRVLQHFKAPADPAQRKDTPRASSRVAVNVDRTERRASIPNNPSRSVAPRSDSQVRQQQPQPQSRSSAIADMRRARGQPVAS